MFLTKVKEIKIVKNSDRDAKYDRIVNICGIYNLQCRLSSLSKNSSF